MTTPSATLLNHAGIAARVPHAGAMCLLDTLQAWDADRIHCTAVSHVDLHHPLRTKHGLLAPVAIEYAGQAMALHAGLVAAPGSTPRAGFLASARGLVCHVPRLDDTHAPLHIHAHNLLGDARQAQYSFKLTDANGRGLVEGRATVVLAGVPGPA